jgi:hypothetical protein
MALLFGLAVARRENVAALKPHIDALDRNLPISVCYFYIEMHNLRLNKISSPWLCI